MSFHSALGDNDIHRVYDQSYADTTARDADTTWNGNSSNVGKCVYVTGTTELYMLVATTPTWIHLSQDETTETDTVYTANGTISASRTVTGYSGNTLTFRHFNDADGSAYTLRSAIVQEDSDIKLSLFLGNGFGADLAESKLEFTNGGILFTDAIASEGIRYAADYSSGATSRWLPDKSYVDAATLGGTDQTLSADRDVYLSDNDLTFYKGANDTSTDILQIHGDGSHSLFNPFVSLHEGYKTGNGSDTQALIINHGKANRWMWNDGTSSSNIFSIESIVNASQTFQYMQTSFQSTRHDYIEVDQWDITFDTGASAVGATTWYDDEAKTAICLQINRDGEVHMGNGFLTFDSDFGVEFWHAAGRSSGYWAIDHNATNENLEIKHNNGTTTTVVATFDDTSLDLQLEGNLTIEGTTSGIVVPTYAAQAEGAATNVTVTTTDQAITIDSVTLDGSGTEYTISTANNRVDFDTGDGAKIYEVIWHANFLLEGQATTGATRSSGVIHAELDAVDVTGSEEWCYIREYQGGTNGFANSGTSGSFLVQPALNDQLVFYVRGETEAGQTLTDFELDSFTIIVKRVR